MKARNKALATLQSEVELSRQKLIELNELQLLETHACLVWRAFNQNNWEHILAMHPLAGDATSLRSVATSYVIEADIANIKNVHDDARSDSLIGRVLASVGDRWDSVRTPAGLWLIKPNCDQVILVGLGYVATDGTDEEAVQALLTAASQLPFRFPIVGVSKNISSLMTTCMDRMGLNWSVRSLIKTRIAAALKLK